MREARLLHTVVTAVIVAAALMICTGILGRSLVRVKTTGEVIGVDQQGHSLCLGTAALPLHQNTKLSELKVTMQAEAARDARARAEQIARSSGCRLGPLRFARMNVPQITPLYSDREWDGGIDDTSALDKRITAIVVAGYSIR
jgi:hypothetical protein